jgi:hypothetical protein
MIVLENYQKIVKGFTTNPSLMNKACALGSKLLGGCGYFNFFTKLIYFPT